MACAASALLISLGAAAANVRTTPPYGTGTGPVIPVILTPATGDQIASLQFRLNFDTSQFAISRVDIGAGASQAGKDVIFAEHSGYATVIVAGLNQDTIPGGPLATVYLEPLGSATLPVGVGISSPVISDPMGNRIEFTNPPSTNDPDSNNADPEPSPGTDKGNDAPTPETPAVPVSTPATPTSGTSNNRPYYGDGALGNGTGLRGTTEDYDNAAGSASRNRETAQNAAATQSGGVNRPNYDVDGSGAMGGGTVPGELGANYGLRNGSPTPGGTANRIGYRPGNSASTAATPSPATGNGVAAGGTPVGSRPSAEHMALQSDNGAALKGAAAAPSALGPLVSSHTSTRAVFGLAVAALALVAASTAGLLRWRKAKARR